MNDTDQLDVLIAVYLIPDLAQQDFDAYVKLAEAGTIVTDGVAVVVKDADGEVHVQETGDHMGRKGAKIGGGVGLVVGLFAPPLLAATAVGAGLGALTGKFVRHRVTAGIGEKLDDALPPGSAGLIAVHEHANADEADTAAHLGAFSAHVVACLLYVHLAISFLDDNGNAVGDDRPRLGELHVRVEVLLSQVRDEVDGDQDVQLIGVAH